MGVLSVCVVCEWLYENMRFISGVSPIESISGVLSVILGNIGGLEGL